jgi:hypothetical protein
LTETKSKSKFPISSAEDPNKKFEKDLENKMTPEDYFAPCYNFHSEQDKRIDVNNFSEIKSDMKNLFDKNKINKMNLPSRQSKSKPLDNNDLMVLFESSLQGMTLTQSAFDRQTEENIKFNLENEEFQKNRDLGSMDTTNESEKHKGRETFHMLRQSGTFEEEDLKQSFVSFLGSGENEIGEKEKEQVFDNFTDLIENIQFEKKMNFTKSKNSDLVNEKIPCKGKKSQHLKNWMKKRFRKEFWSFILRTLPERIVIPN